MKQFDEMYALLHCHGWEHMFKIYLQIFLSAAFSKKSRTFLIVYSLNNTGFLKQILILIFGN